MQFRISRSMPNCGEWFPAIPASGIPVSVRKDPVLYLGNPQKTDGKGPKEVLDYLKSLNEVQLDTYGSPEINARTI
jgi:hypothetical protein